MSKILKCLFGMSVIGAIATGLPQSTEAGGLPARAGKPDWPVWDPGCWGLNGGTVQNICTVQKAWWMPLVNIGPGSFSVTVTAQAASISNNVLCSSTGASAGATFFSSSGVVSLPQFGAAANIVLPTTVPFGGGSAMVDCYANPGGKIHTLNF